MRYAQAGKLFIAGAALAGGYDAPCQNWDGHICRLPLQIWPAGLSSRAPGFHSVLLVHQELHQLAAVLRINYSSTLHYVSELLLDLLLECHPTLSVCNGDSQRWHVP